MFGNSFQSGNDVGAFARDPRRLYLDRAWLVSAVEHREEMAGRVFQENGCEVPPIVV